MTCESDDNRKCPWFNRNKILKRHTLPEMRVYTHRVNNMAVGSTGVTRIVCADKQNDIPDGDDEFYTKHFSVTRRFDR